MADWQQAQQWEADWWGACVNTFGEQEKQITYARKMGLSFFHDGKSPWNIDLVAKSVVDIGGGPCSLLLLCRGGRGTVWDPLLVPEWVKARYLDAGISIRPFPAEELTGEYDEAWVYNVLQHCADPQGVISRAKACAKTIRIFEWIDTPANEGHPHTLTEANLNEWLGGRGTVEMLNLPTLKGKAYYGVFGPPLETPDHFRFHFPGLVHLPVSDEYAGCAFTMKIHKLSKMLLSLGHEVYLYGAEGSDAPCTEFVQTHTLEDIRRTWGDNPPSGELGYDWRKENFRHDFNTKRTPLTGRFMLKCIKEIDARKRPDDFFLLSQGQYHKPIADKVNLWLTCEPGVGYRGSFAKYKAFESAYLMNFTYGSSNPGKSINGNYYDRVIPNYFDPKDFEFSDKKDGYFLFIGRMISRKGVWTAIKTTEAIGAKLILAGQESDEINVSNLPPHCEFVGYVDPPQRNELMKHAKGVFVPTQYLEAFGGVNVEAQLCGTPVLTTNFGVFPETVLQGVTGFRCDTLQDFVEAAKKVGELDPIDIRRHANRYLMDNVKWEFQKWFQDLYQLYLSAHQLGTKGWSHLEV